MEATTKDLRLRTKELISATDRGERVIITYRGKPRAQLVPLAEGDEREGGRQGKRQGERQGEAVPAREGRNPAFGIWADRTPGQTVDEELRQLRRPRTFD